MLALYPTIYRDAHGEEETVIENDGQTLRMVVRGAEFISPPFGSFDNFTPTSEDGVGLSQFKLNSFRELIAASPQIDIPLPIVVEDEVAPSTLKVAIDLEGFGSRRLLGDAADPQMTLIFGDHLIASRGGWGAFETELIQIQRQMPPNAYMECCFNCAFSGYSPYGNGLWGMYCHRNYKEEYVQANDKREWIRLDCHSAGTVQETYLCPEFQRWNGESGYRDPLHVRPIEIQ